MPGNKVQIIIEVDGRQVKGEISGLENALTSFGRQASQAGETASRGLSTLSEQSAGLARNLDSLRRLAVGTLAVFGVSTLAGFFQDAIDASNQLKTSTLGLQSVAKNLSVDMGAATKSAQELTKDGILNLSDASKGLQNLLASGLNLPQAIKLMNMNKDAAIFNRQAHLGLSESIKVFTDGFKNELSTLTDATGISTNYSRALADTFKLIKAGRLDFSKYRDILTESQIATMKQAAAHTNNAEALDKQSKSLVTMIGFLKEGELFAGNAAKGAEMLTVKEQQLENQMLLTKAAIGDQLLPVKLKLLQATKGLLDTTNDFTLGVKNGRIPLKEFALALGGIYAMGKLVSLGNFILQMGGLRAAAYAAIVPLKILLTTVTPLGAAGGVAALALGAFLVAYRKIGEETAINDNLRQTLELMDKISKKGLIAGLPKEDLQAIARSAKEQAESFDETKTMEEIFAERVQAAAQARAALAKGAVTLSITAGGPPIKPFAKPPLTDEELAKLKRIAEQREQIDFQISALNQKALMGIDAQFAAINLELARILAKDVITPSQRDASIEAAFGAKAALLEEFNRKMADEGLKTISKAVQTDIEEGLKHSNENILDDFRRRIDAQKTLEQLRTETTLNLATTEGERLAIENKKKLEDFGRTFKGMQDFAKFYYAYEDALNQQTNSMIMARNRERLQSLQEEIALLGAETAQGMPRFSLFGNNAKFSAEQARLQTQQGIDMARAQRESASPEVLAALGDKHHLEMIKLAQERYTDLYSNIAEHAGRVWDGIFQKGKSGWQGLMEYIKGTWATAMRKLFSDFVASLLTPMFSRLSGAFGGIAGGGGGGGGAGGGLLGNLFGGLLGGGGGGGLGIPGGVFQGSSQGGMIFSAAGGGGAQRGGFTGMLGNLLGGGSMAAPGLIAGSLGGALPSIAGAGLAGALPASIYASSTVPGMTAATAFGGAGAGAGGGMAALTGFLLNPWTIGIAAAIIAGIALFKHFHNRQEKKFQNEILRDFAINMQDMKALKQIVQIGKSAFGKQADRKHFETLHMDSVQAILMNYALQTGQSPMALPLYQRFASPAMNVALDQANIPHFAQGGVVPGIDRGRDSVLSLLRPGEIVFPRRDFQDLVLPSSTRQQPIQLIVQVDAHGSTDPAATAREVEKAVKRAFQEVSNGSSLHKAMEKVIEKSGRAVVRSLNKGLATDYGRRELMDNLLGQ